jgi:hypothetical protein
VGCVARMVKLVDLDDHLSHPPASKAPDYAWARAVIVDSQERHRERFPGASALGETVESAA